MSFSLHARRVATALTVATALLLLPASVAFAQDGSGAPQQQPQQQQADLVSTLEAEGNFTALLNALSATGLDEQFQGQDAFTLFAPTDAAFAQLPEGTLDSLSADQLRGILESHVVSGRATAGDLASAGQAKALSGRTLTFEQAGGGLTVNGTAITGADLEASNGVVHAIDGVLIPQKSSGSSSPGAGDRR